jgi:hypothetical protein
MAVAKPGAGHLPGGLRGAERQVQLLGRRHRSPDLNLQIFRFTRRVAGEDRGTSRNRRHGADYSEADAVATAALVDTHRQHRVGLQREVAARFGRLRLADPVLLDALSPGGLLGGDLFDDD